MWEDCIRKELQREKIIVFPEGSGAISNLEISGLGKIPVTEDQVLIPPRYSRG
jgi:hypothetical protein